MGKAKGRADRYDLAEARDLGQRGEPSPHALKNKNIEVDTAAVLNPLFDPNSKKSERVIANVNRRVDILEYEHSHRRISVEAYREGRVVQALFERSGIIGGSTWSAGSRIDAEVAKEIAILRRIADARTIQVQMKMLHDALGKNSIDVVIIRQVLGENRRYADVVLPQRKANNRERGIGYIAQRFRDALETLARGARRR